MRRSRSQCPASLGAQRYPAGSQPEASEGLAPGGMSSPAFFFFFQAEDGIRDHCVTGVQTCALPISTATLSPACFARCEKTTLPPGATTIAPPSCAGLPIVRPCTTPYFAVASAPLVTEDRKSVV